MHVQALDASAINAVASTRGSRYPAAVSVTESALDPAVAEPAAGTAPPSAPPAGEAVVSTWRAIAASHAAASVALERELARLGLGVSEFEVLDRLSESREHKFRAQ